jgi:RNA 2',3'-cyclic 3'-phosphodiesterase
MPEQLLLPGLEVPRQRTDRLFFALLPDSGAATQIERCSQHLRGKHGLTGRSIAPERFHITLHFIDDYAGLPPRIVASVSEAVASVAIPPFDVMLNRARSFCENRPLNRPFVLIPSEDNLALSALQRAVGAAMTKAHVGRPAARHFTPHLTLLYDDRCVENHAIETIAWTAREFVLVHSLLGRTRHVPLARWPLRA